MPGETIVCIYCKQTKPPSREHAVQRSLGGDLVLRDVCEDCNHGFSPIDQALADNSFISLLRVGLTPSTAFGVKLGGENFFTDPASGLTMEVAVRNGMRAEVYPQLHIRLDGNGQTSVALSVKDRADFERLARFVERKATGAQLRSIHVKTGPTDAGATARLIIHRDDDGFVRGQSQGDVERLFLFLESGWSDFAAEWRARFDGAAPPQAEEVKNPAVQTIQTINLNHVYRAIAKIAFNVMAARLGAAFALGSGFDGIREYIRGSDVRLPIVGPGEAAVDGRFVTTVPPGTEPAIPCDDHAVAIFRGSGGIVAWVTLYKTSNFIVRLSEAAPSDFVTQVHVFSATRGGNAPLDLEEILRRLRARTSATS